MGKIKIHELAKELGLPSKEVLEQAKKIGIEVSSHLSNIEDKQAEQIKNAFSKTTKNKKDNIKVKENKVGNKKEVKKDAPVIIRREVILNDDDEVKKEESKKVEERKDIGFVKRRNNNDYNIVYRNKPNKPLTVNELFGLGKKEEKPKVEEKTAFRQNRLAF